MAIDAANEAVFITDSEAKALQENTTCRRTPPAGEHHLQEK